MPTIYVRYEPDYEVECENCGQTPCVTGVCITTKRVVYESDMCGPCTFGTAAALDIEWWNAEEHE